MLSPCFRRNHAAADDGGFAIWMDHKIECFAQPSSSDPLEDHEVLDCRTFAVLLTASSSRASAPRRLLKTLMLGRSAHSHRSGIIIRPRQEQPSYPVSSIPHERTYSSCSTCGRSAVILLSDRVYRTTDEHRRILSPASRDEPGYPSEIPPNHAPRHWQRRRLGNWSTAAMGRFRGCMCTGKSNVDKDKAM